MRTIVLVLCLGAAACSPASTACVPGASIACVGAGGCAGGQACNAAGSGYGACLCSGSDAGMTVDANVGTDTGAQDAGSDAGVDAFTPATAGALRVHWTFMRGGTAETCATVTGLDHIVVVSSSASASLDDSFPCAPGAGLTQALPFGTYTYVASAVNGSGASLGDSNDAIIPLAASPCDERVGDLCVHDVNVVIQVF